MNKQKLGEAIVCMLRAVALDPDFKLPYLAPLDDNVCSKLFCPRSRTTSEIDVRRALGLYIQRKLLEI